MSDLSELTDKLDDDGDLHSADSNAGFGPGVVGVASHVTSSSWVPFTGLFSNLFLLVYYYLLLLMLPHFLVGYSFGTVDLGIVVFKIRKYISSHGIFWFVIRKYYFDLSGRSDLSDVLANSYLNTTEFDRWPQSITFECKEICKKKSYSYLDYSFCAHVAFDRSIRGYVVKRCRDLNIGHFVNLSFIIGHVRSEGDLSVEERSQLANFRKK